jgi:DNA-binding NarL/FixJ family response regulator
VELEGRLNRKEQQANFDKIFLAMFPNFIEQFNGLLKPENRMEPSEKELMSPSMRIFALIRLGLKDNQQIAKVLDYSYNTILNYRVRTRGGAKNPETFESDIMNIQ